MALITVLLLVIVVTLTIVGVSNRVRQQLRGGVTEGHTLQANYAARAGLQRSLRQLMLDPSWEPGAGFRQDVAEHLAFRVTGSSNEIIAPVATEPGNVVFGHRLQLSSTGLVDDQPMGGGLGLAQGEAVRPDPVFVNALNISGQPLVLNANAAVSRIDSYEPAVLYDPLAAPRRDASVRAQQGVNLIGCYSDGDIIVPSAQAVVQANPGDYTGSLVVDPSEQVPWVFRKPAAYVSTTAVDPGTLYAAGSPPGCVAPAGATLAPGSYTTLTTTEGPAGDLTLRSGEYYVAQRLAFGADTHVRLDPSVTADAPCIVYVGRELMLDPNVEMALDPAPGQSEPDPRRLQFYLCDEFPEGTSTLFLGIASRSACVIAGQHVRGSLNTGGVLRPLARRGVTLFGALYCESLVETSGVGGTPADFSLKVHYSRDLARRRCQGQTQWVLVNQTNR